MAETNARGLVAADGVELALFETHCDVGEGLTDDELLVEGA